MHIKELVKEVKANPKKYLVKENVEDIENLLTGYLYELELLHKQTEINYLFNHHFTNWTGNWLKNHDFKVGEKKAQWSLILNFTILDETKAYDLFYDIISDFFSIYLEKNQSNRKEFIEEKEIHIHLDEMIGYVKKRPLMFITSKKVENIECFLRGFILAIQLYDKNNEFDEAFEKDFCKWTKEWLYKNRNICFNEEYSNWSCYIRQASEDDEDSFNLFFEIEEAFEKELQNK